MAKTSYALALGSNRRHGTHGGPAAVLRAALAALEESGIGLLAVSSIRATKALGPAGRGFANAAAILETRLEPPALLERLKQLERSFGRRPGRRWGPRVLDLDILLWSEGAWAGDGLIVPHPEFRRRRFVLEPLAEIAPAWRDPLSGLAVRHLLARARRPRPVDPKSPRS
jgi:2-amino-4-hydroxy-6-hydroxymethyldihydropteridine diphosphokinase